MTNLTDLFDKNLFDAMVDGGYVRVQHHPEFDLHIANYAEKAQFEHVWNDVTLTCRGLIFDSSGEIKARPYRKFFNYGDEQNTGPLDLDAPVVVTDKLDGSLGILYPTPHGGWAISTRGSFTSDQALHATQVLQSRYPDFQPLPNFTYLWEIVYPENRIVVDYNGFDDLILHGLMHIPTGRVSETLGDDTWLGPEAETFGYESLSQAIAAAPRANREGLVVRYTDTDLMVKLKQEDYVALHRIITGLNARTVWEWIGGGKTVGDLCATLPDEFHGWVLDLVAELETAAAQMLKGAQEAHAQILASLPLVYGRRDYAALASKSAYRPYLFLLLDGREQTCRESIWREIKPSGARSMVNHSETVA
jgi:RNA ligase